MAAEGGQREDHFVLPAIPSNNDFDQDPEVITAVSGWRSRRPGCQWTGCMAYPAPAHAACSLQMWDVIQVGAGVAGAALAYAQAKVGTASRG